MTLGLEEFAERLEKAGYKTGANLLEVATKEYKESPTSPEKVTAFWQAFWMENGKKVDILVSVPECPCTQEQLEDMRRKDKTPIYIPEELSTQKTRHLLGKMFPEMQSHSVKEGNGVTNEVQNFGWRSFDISVDAPYLKTNESQLEGVLTDSEEEKPTLDEYIIAGQANKLLVGRYLDEDTTVSRILGSRSDGFVVGACFGSGGSLRVDSGLDPVAGDPALGGRGSSGVSGL